MIDSKNIFLMGKAGSGKDTAALMLNRKYGYKPIAFADNIRAEYRRFFPEGNPRTDRAKMIEIGQTYKHLYGNDVWVRETASDIHKQFNQSYDIVITDGRHQVEYDFFVLCGHYVPVWINCPDEIRCQRIMDRDGTLQEEALKKECQDLWEVDAYVLDNSGTINQLENGIATLMKYLSR